MKTLTKKRQMTFGTIEQAIEDIQAGRLVIVADDEDRESEGDLIGAAEMVTPEMIITQKMQNSVCH